MVQAIPLEKTYKCAPRVNKHGHQHDFGSNDTGNRDHLLAEAEESEKRSTTALGELRKHDVSRYEKNNVRALTL